MIGGINLFQVGDVVKGLDNNGYGITNSNMKKALVISAGAGTSSMEIIVCEHTNRIIPYKGQIFAVQNDEKRFKFVSHIDLDNLFYDKYSIGCMSLKNQHRTYNKPILKSNSRVKGVCSKELIGCIVVNNLFGNLENDEYPIMTNGFCYYKK